MTKIPATACTAALIALALAQAHAQAAPANSSDAPLFDRSAFEDYRAFRQEQVQPWKQANDAVRDAGGWRAYARAASGAQAPAPAPEGAAARGPDGGAQPQPASPHAGHRQP